MDVSIGRVIKVLTGHVWTELEVHFHDGRWKVGLVKFAEIVIKKVIIFRVGDLKTVSVKSEVGGWAFLRGFEKTSILHLNNE